ncbi:hypothetical protein HB761_02195 [Vibrio campbellii]|uniref:Uncharacterized protein n=1 Tax=Vibrio campbellii TaxID=680 RepID=A0AAE9MXG9_9VIBR|nr:hypothetical protein [Vibrio campbellii]UTZ25661.1 hypothetical protein HB761_02195 [Vibrio campbellii]
MNYDLIKITPKNDNIDNARSFGVQFSGAMQFGKLIPEPQGTNLHVSSAWSKGEYKEMDDAIGSLGPIIKDTYV